MAFLSVNYTDPDAGKKKGPNNAKHLFFTNENDFLPSSFAG